MRGIPLDPACPLLLGAAAMISLELVATVLGVACVALAAVRSLWTFPVAIGSVALLGIVVWRERLYSDALLQAFFVAANLYGWRQWQRHRDRTGDLMVGRMTRAALARWLAAIAGGTLLWGGAMAALTDAAFPWWDAGIAMTSVAAQLLMAQRRVENWWLWIAVDLASVPLYLAKGLGLFALLYLVYLALAVWGWVGWHRARGTGTASA